MSSQSHLALYNGLAHLETLGANLEKIHPDVPEQNLTLKFQANSTLFERELHSKLNALCPWTNSFHLTQTSH